MQDIRQALPQGTRVTLLSSGSIFEISGEPIGFGGGGMIYPARRMIRKNGRLLADGIHYALKECYPVSGGQDYFRSETGEIQAGDPEHRSSLEHARKRHSEEKERNQEIHVTASRILPILEASDSVELTLPGKEPVPVSNAVSIMESLENKGRSLSECLAERRRFSALETCRILQQLLFALREVHDAGYLHLDIQGGNVFLRGALEDKSDFLTLIDFGSARPLGQNGRTEVIRDREIFTSPGFSAPEMLLSNTGTLQLGREADLYSVGCVALYLLTGQRPNQSQLLANRSGKYLKPNQMRWVDCPVHLQDRLQALLAGALARKPEDRWTSAEEMLEKVNELLEALKPARTVLSAVKYDAFICYKHGPADSPVAKALQQRMEHFHTTDNAGKKIRPFRQVFLDEGELSACADFGQMIRDALSNSKWLLVICSEDTPLSPWVKLEIGTFLEIHGAAARSRILTVLTSGEPADSIPPGLFEPGACGEPFAADIRGRDLRQILKNLKGDPFLRLAAAMLDRPFDSLKQRRKIYILQRVAAAAGVLLLAATAFAAYAVNRSDLIAVQAVRIREEYTRSLINESLFLAEQAQKQLRNNDPLEAMELARAALPTPDQDRPVVTEAEYVLGKSLGVYITPGAAENTMTAAGVIDTEDDRFFLDNTGSRLFTWKHSENGIRVWDAETLAPIRMLLPREAVCSASEELLIPQQNTLILQVSGGIISLNYLTGEQNWRYESENVLAVCLSEDKTRVAVLSEGEENGEKISCLEILPAASGEPERRISFRMEPEHEADRRLVLSPDLKWAAVPASDTVNSFDILNKRHSLYLLRLEDGDCRKLPDTDTEIITLKFLEDRLAVIRGKGYSFSSRQNNVVYQYTEPIAANIELYEPDSGRLLWCSAHRYSPWEKGVDSVELVSYDTGTVSGKGLTAVCSDLCVLLDWDSGRLIREYELQSSVLDIRYEKNGIETLNADGSSTWISYSLDAMLNIPYLGNSVSAVCRYQDNYYVQSTPVFSGDHSIRKYVLGKYDETYIKLFDACLMDWGYYGYRCTQEGTRLVLAGDHQICYMDSTDSSVLTYEIPAQYSFSPYRVTGLSTDARRVYWCTDEWDASAFWITDRALWVTDLLTGGSRQLPMPAKPEEPMTVMDFLFFEESLYFAASIPAMDGFEVALFQWDLREGSLKELYRYALAPADEEGGHSREDYQYRSLQLDEAERQISFATVNNGSGLPRRLVRVSLSGRETAVVSPENMPEMGEEGPGQWQRYCCQWSPEGTLVSFGSGDSVYVMNREGKYLCRIPAAGYGPVARFLPDGESMLVLTDDLMLSQYRICDGACQTVIDLNDHLETSIPDPGRVQLVSVDKSTMALFVGWDGFLLDISGEAVRIKALLDQGIGYDAGTDCFLAAESGSYSGRPSTVGKFPRYSLEELIQKANAIINTGK